MILRFHSIVLFLVYMISKMASHLEQQIDDIETKLRETTDMSTRQR
jgi:hypothetical protein